MPDNSYPVATAVHLSPSGRIVIMLWPRGGSAAGIHAEAKLLPEEARVLVGQIEEQLNAMPRIGTPADLGCEVL